LYCIFLIEPANYRQVIGLSSDLALNFTSAHPTQV